MSGNLRCPNPAHTAPMVRRRNKQTGGLFFGCPEWPECRETAEEPLAAKLRAAGQPELPLFEGTNEQ